MTLNLLSNLQARRQRRTLFAPTPTLSLDGQGGTLNYLILDVLNNVRSEVRLC